MHEADRKEIWEFEKRSLNIIQVVVMMLLMTRKRAKLSDQIRQAVDESGMSRYAICKATGIDQGMFSHFMAGKVALGLANVDKLADLLGLDVVARKKRGRKAR